MGKIIALAMPKGGVAKTTSAVNLSISLANKQKRVLLIEKTEFGKSLCFQFPAPQFQ